MVRSVRIAFAVARSVRPPGERWGRRPNAARGEVALAASIAMHRSCSQESGAGSHRATGRAQKIMATAQAASANRHDQAQISRRRRISQAAIRAVRGSSRTLVQKLATTARQKVPNM